MKRTPLILILLFLPALAYCLAVPPLRGHVNDDAALLSAAKRVELEKQLTDFERQEIYPDRGVNHPLWPEKTWRSSR